MTENTAYRALTGKFPDNVLKIMEVLREAGYKSWIVGGCVRDMLLQKEPKDWDIVTTAQPHTVMHLFEKCIPVGLKHGIVTVVLGDQSYEVATLRRDVQCDGRHAQVEYSYSLEEDLYRRDFTINAMAMNHMGVLYDGAGGQHDLLVEKRIVCVGDPLRRFAEDRLRMLRAIRFASRLGFKIEKFTMKVIQSAAAQITDISAERIRMELLGILATERAVQGVQLLEESGLLKYVLPEVQAEIGFSQRSPWHDKDVYEHTLDVLENMCKLTTDPILRFAALLHDIGKVPTRTENEHGNYNFYKHDFVGANMARMVCERLKFSNADTEKIVFLIERHLELKMVMDSKNNKRTISRYIRRNWRYLNDLLLLAVADREKVSFDEPVQAVVDMLDEMKEAELNAPPASLLNGTDLCVLFDRKPGSWIRPIKEALVEAQIRGTVLTKEQALVWVKEFPG